MTKGGFWLFAVGLVGCGPPPAPVPPEAFGTVPLHDDSASVAVEEPLPPVPRRPGRQTKPGSAGKAADDAPALGSHDSSASPFSRRFEVKVPGLDAGDLDAVLLTPTGEVLTFADKKLRVHRPDGTVDRSAAVEDPKAVGFTRSDRLTLVSRRGLSHFSWPELVRSDVNLPEVLAAAVAPGRVATVHGSPFRGPRRVRILALDGPTGGAPAGAGSVVDWFDVQAPIRRWVFSRDGGQLAMQRGAKVVVRDVANRKDGISYPASSTLDGLAFSADGTRLLLGAESPVEIRTSDGGALKAHDEMFMARTMAYVGDRIVATTYDRAATLDAPRRKWTMKHPILSPSGDAMCGGVDGALHCLSMKRARPMASAPLPKTAPPKEPPIPGTPPPPRSAPPGYAKLWSDTLTKAPLRLRAAPDGKSLLAWTDWTTVAVRNMATGKTERTATICAGHDYAFGFAGDKHFIGICENHVVRYGWPTLAEEKNLRLPNDMNSGAMGDGFFAVDVEDQAEVRVYRLADMKLAFSLKTDAVIWEDSMVMSPNGKRLAFATAGGTWVVDLATKKKTRVGEPVRNLQLSPDGTRMLMLGTTLAEVSSQDGAQLRTWSVRRPHHAAYAGDAIAAKTWDAFSVLTGTGATSPSWVKGFDGPIEGAPDGTVCASGKTVLTCFGPKKAP